MRRRSIEEGDRLPDFELKDQDGRTVRSKDMIGKGPFVVYFYPQDDTPGCTTEACAFRDAFEDLKDAGAEVYGISSDTPESHKAFASKHRLPFILLADEGGHVREAFGVPKSMGIMPGRVTYVFGPDGTLRFSFNSQSRAKQHVERSLDFIKKMRDGAP
jgi:peroxiredoxin Q/BCP